MASAVVCPAQQGVERHQRRNGKVTVRDDKVPPVFAGQPIRFEPEAKPRFVPISEESWKGAFSTGMPDDFTGAFPENTGH